MTLESTKNREAFFNVFDMKVFETSLLHCKHIKRSSTFLDWVNPLLAASFRKLMKTEITIYLRTSHST